MRRASVARIDEPRCIGCTRCIDACPVDAISGANGFLHAVIADWCIGCKLCVPPCPVDCIDMVPADGPWTAADGRAARHRAAARKIRAPHDGPSTPARDRRAVIDAILKGRGLR
jgi:Na+-translocating ferredoxin:NAD+ oxidoreductase subunit B